MLKLTLMFKLFVFTNELMIDLIVLIQAPYKPRQISPLINHDFLILINVPSGKLQ